MKFLEFQKAVKDFSLFSLHDLRLLFPHENHSTVSTQISSWAKDGKIVKLKNGLYALSSQYSGDTLSPEVIAAKLYSPSYISMEYALSFYDIIPEAVFSITSVTSKATRIFSTPFGRFSYRTLKPSCFFGFSVFSQGKFPYYMALPEKAVLDFLYLNSDRFTPSEETWDQLRFQNFEKLDFDFLFEMAQKFSYKKLFSLILHLKQYAKSH